MKKLLITTLIATILLAAAPFKGVAEDNEKWLTDRIEGFTTTARTALADTLQTALPNDLPDIVHLGVTWEHWRKVRLVNLIDTAVTYKPRSGGDYRETIDDRRALVVYGALDPLSDPLENTRPAQPNDKIDEYSHGWKAVRTFIKNEKTAEVVLDWVLRDSEKAFLASPEESQVTYRMALKSAIAYIEQVNTATESDYLKKLKDEKFGYGLNERTFVNYRPDGTEREFGKVEAFLFRRLEDGSFTKEELLTLLHKADAVVSKWGSKK